MFSLSKFEPSEVTINDTRYRLKNWSVITTSLEGFRIIKAIAPALGMGFDIHKTNQKQEAAELFEEEQFELGTATGVATQLSESLTDEHFTDLCFKLLKGLSYLNEKGEYVPINDPDEFFSNPEYQGDFLQILTWSMKENLWDFFMKQGMFASKIEMVSKAASRMMNSLEESLTEKKEK